MRKTPIGKFKFVDELNVNLVFLIFILYKLYSDLSTLKLRNPLFSIYLAKSCIVNFAKTLLFKFPHICVKMMVQDENLDIRIRR